MDINLGEDRVHPWGGLREKNVSLGEGGGMCGERERGSWQLSEGGVD